MPNAAPNGKKTWCTSQLLFISDIVDANLSAGAILDRFIARCVGRSENGHLAVVSFACFDGFQRWACQNSPNRSPTSVRFWHVSGYTNVFVPAFRKESGRHPLTIFFPDRVDD